MDLYHATTARNRPRPNLSHKICEVRLSLRIKPKLQFTTVSERHCLRGYY